MNREQVFSETRQPFLLLALNATDAVEWDELDNKVWLLVSYIFLD
jgi:hypothetical protein